MTHCEKVEFLSATLLSSASSPGHNLPFTHQFFFPLNKSFLDALNSASPSMSFSFSNLLKERSFAEPHEVISTKTILGAAAVCVRLLFLLSVVFDLWSLLRRKPISL